MCILVEAAGQLKSALHAFMSRVLWPGRTRDDGSHLPRSLPERHPCL